MDPRRRTGSLMVLAMAVPSAEAAIGLNDPLFYLILDGLLLLYGVVITAFFYREKYRRPKAPHSKEDRVYEELTKPADTYDELRPSRGQRRPADVESQTPQALQNASEDSRKKTGAKKKRRRQRNDQGPSTAKKDAKDTVRMKKLPPNRGTAE